jgi:aspartyl-tRNA synthetase
VTVLSKCETLPFSITDNPNTSEENRFKYRFLDLRRRPVLKNIEFRTKMLSFTRERFFSK